MTPQDQAQRAPADDTSLRPNNPTELFDGIEPWKGEVKKGRQRNFIGALHPIEPWDRDKTFPDETEYQETEPPSISGEKDTSSGSQHLWPSAPHGIASPRYRWGLILAGR